MLMFRLSVTETEGQFSASTTQKWLIIFRNFADLQFSAETEIHFFSNTAALDTLLHLSCVKSSIV